ncbi:MAG: heavy metal translocating P-type ATPase [Aerococcus sp.]|nr:heavy metal translocating P-type ATPase [Aerococcus sp.]
MPKADKGNVVHKEEAMSHKHDEQMAHHDDMEHMHHDHFHDHVQTMHNHEGHDMHHVDMGQHDMHHHDHDMAHMNMDHHSHHGHGNHHMMMIANMKKRFWLTLPLALVVAWLSPMMMMLFHYQVDFTGQRWVEFILSTIVFFYGGQPFLKHGHQELQSKRPGMMMLISLGIIASYAYSVVGSFILTPDPSQGMLGMHNYYFEMVTLILVMLIGHVIEMRSEMTASKDLEALAELLPNEAHRLTSDGSIETVPVTEIKPGDQVLIRPGEKIPLDGEVISGHSEVNEAALTGESVPVDKQKADQVIAGAINGDGSLTMSVEKTGDESYLNQVIQLVQDAQAQKSKTQGLADRIAGYLFYLALGVGLLALVIWWKLDSFDVAIQFMVSAFVIACPHAMGLAVPLVNARSTSLSASAGLLIQQRIPFEEAHKIDTVVFDKTGTLTQGTFGVDEIVSLADWDKDQILQYAYSLERQSEHPIAQGIVRYAEDQHMQTLTVDDFNSLTGKGLSGTIQGQNIQILSPKATEQAGINLDTEALTKASQKGRTVVVVIADKQAVGLIASSDQVRKEAKDVIQKLHEQGIQAVMMTGDQDSVAQAVGETLAIDHVFSEVRPDEKASHIQELQSEGHAVMMIGDGINDAPALAQAEVGVAIGAGTDVAIESADIILVENDIYDTLNVLALSKATQRKIKQNLWWGAGYNLIALPIAAGVLAPIGVTIGPALSGLIMSFSTVICAVNAQLLNDSVLVHKR